MIAIRKIRKMDIPELLADDNFWNNSFLAVSRHRLYSHYKNPTAADEDVVLLLAYLDNELVGYMGAYTDKIILNNVGQKIAWLSTWWVHPKTKGSGIGREILDTMYTINDGKIGISQFTPSAKRVYDKSGYFTALKSNVGLKAVVRLTFAFIVPTKYPKLKFFRPVLMALDFIANIAIGIKLYFCGQHIKGKLRDTAVEYLNNVDGETDELIRKHSNSHIARKTPEFFEWLKKYHWVNEAPLLELTQKDKYEFSIYDQTFNIYLIKIIRRNISVAFVVLQKRNATLKVLFAYYDTSHIETVADIIKLHAIRQRIDEVICYDPGLCENFKRSAIFVYNKKKIKHSIISKAFNQSNFDNVIMNFGDGDCSFA